MNRWWLVYRSLYGSLGLNELIPEWYILHLLVAFGDPFVIRIVSKKSEKLDIVLMTYRVVETHVLWHILFIVFKRVIIPPEQRSCWGVYWFHSVRLSVRLSVRPSVRQSRLPCPLCNIYSSGWILSILATNDHYHERVCRTQWPLTLTYIFKVIWPWLRKSCPLCSVYNYRWIRFIFSTNDYYH